MATIKDLLNLCNGIADKAKKLYVKIEGETVIDWQFAPYQDLAETTVQEVINKFATKPEKATKKEKEVDNV